MQAEAIPQTLLKNKVSDSTTYITAMQALNTKVAALADAATAASKPAGVDLHTATASSPSITATAGPAPRTEPWTSPSTSSRSRR